MVKKILKGFGIAALALVLAVVLYLSYVLLSYSRIEDNQSITPVKSGADESVKVGESYSALIQNLGFGAYTQDFTFFMDGGTQSWAESEQSV